MHRRGVVGRRVSRRRGGRRRGADRHAAFERALTRGNLRRPGGGAAAWRRRGGLLRRRRGVPAALRMFAGCAAVLGDHLIEAAIEPRQRIGNPIGGWNVVAARATMNGGVGPRHALELLRQFVETLVDRGEVVAERVLVVVVGLSV
jgi:hypothetical protein